VSSELAAVNWVELEGSVNVRDLGGLRTADGARVRRGALIRSANLQHLTAADIRVLREDFDIRQVVDLRTDVEVTKEGPGPLHGEPAVVIHHLSLYPDGTMFVDKSESSDETDEPAANVGLLSEAEEETVDGRPAFVAHYLRYLQLRPESILAAFRAVAEPGGTIVHCAAGKDRTGVVVALILSAVGVPAESIAADYAATELQIEAIAAHLRRSTSDIYSREMAKSERIPPPSTELMLTVLEAVEQDFGGVDGWLSSQGWTDADARRLRQQLLAAD
jgi:protein-tyrosine phosphatase